MTLAPLAGAYGSFSPGGAALYATSAAFRALAGRLRQADRDVIDLDSPPEDLVEEAPIRHLKITILSSAEPAAIFRQDDVLELAGGLDAMCKLAETIENLADLTDRLGGAVQPHVDLEYFPGHGFLDSRSIWLTLLLIEGV